MLYWSFSAVRRWHGTSFQHLHLPPCQNSRGKVLHKHGNSRTVLYVLWETKQNTVNYPFLWKKRCSCYGHWRKLYKKIKKERDSKVARRPVQLTAVHSTKHVSLKDCFVGGVQYFHLLFGRLKGEDCFETGGGNITVLWRQKLSHKSETIFFFAKSEIHAENV